MKTITKIGNGFDLYNPFDKIKIIINKPSEEPHESKVQYLNAIGDHYVRNIDHIPENIFKAATFSLNNYDEFALLLDENNNPTDVKLFYGD